MSFPILIITAYLLGSIPFGLIIAKAHGKDLRNVGSGNIGATNVSRVLGKKWAYFCFLLDVLKGMLPTLAAIKLISKPPTTIQLLLWLMVGIAAVAGHIFPLYVKFKGGKGVATSFGFALGIWPYYTITAPIAFIVWLIAVLIWRYISLASMIASAAFTVTLALIISIKPQWSFAQLWPLMAVAVAIPALVILRHRENIKRIIAGTENKVLRKNCKSKYWKKDGT